jgi:hypothetical protein
MEIVIRDRKVHITDIRVRSVCRKPDGQIRIPSELVEVPDCKAGADIGFTGRNP